MGAVKNPGALIMTTMANIPQPNSRLFLKTTVGMLLLVSSGTASAVPSLIPLVPLIGILIAKGALLIGSLSLFVLSLYKENRRGFLLWGALLFAALILLMVIY